MKLDRRFADLTMTTAFTWGKAMDYQTGDDGNLLWLIGRARNYARADFDRTFNFVQSYVYQLPLGVGQEDGSPTDRPRGFWATGRSPAS